MSSSAVQPPSCMTNVWVVEKNHCMWEHWHDAQTRLPLKYLPLPQVLYLYFSGLYSKVCLLHWPSWQVSFFMLKFTLWKKSHWRPHGLTSSILCLGNFFVNSLKTWDWMEKLWIMCSKVYGSTVWVGDVGGVYNLIFSLFETNAFIQYNIIKYNRLALACLSTWSVFSSRFCVSVCTILISNHSRQQENLCHRTSSMFSFCTEMWVNVWARPLKAHCQVPFWSALWTKH